MRYSSFDHLVSTDPSLIAKGPLALIFIEDQVEIDTSPIHPAIPAMNQIIASVGREAKASGLVAAGYVFVDPEVFFES